VAYLNGSKVLTTGSALTFDGSNLGLGVTPTVGWSNYRALQIGQFGFLAYNSGTPSTEIGQNYYYNGTNYIAVTSGTAARFVVNNNNTAGFAWYSANASAGNAISFTQAATLTAAGDFLVGKTAKGDTLASGAGFTLASTNTTASHVFTASNANWMQILNRFDAGAGYFLFQIANSIVGSIGTNGTSTSYNTSSDYRLKNITGPITNSGAYIDSLNPVEGTWKADGSVFVGLIAHEAQEASRTAVATGIKDGEDMQGMDYSSAEIIANMLAELKSLRARVAALESN
jgi:hypothetical protein